MYCVEFIYEQSLRDHSCFDAGEEDAVGERFRQVVVGAGVESRHHVLLAVAGGEHEDGTAAPSGRPRILRHTAMPSIPGNMRSRTTSRGFFP